MRGSNKHVVSILATVMLIVMTVFCMQWLPTTAAAGPYKLCAAHPISVTETDVFVTRTKAIVRVRMFAEDLMLFQGLEPNDQDVISAADLQQGLKQHRQFLLDKITLRDAAGQPYPGSITDLKPFQIPDEGIPVSDLMLHTATYQIEYPFPEPPEFLTLQQDISDDNFIFPSEMKVSVHQTGSELTFTDALKAGGNVTLRFDWDATPLSDDASDAEWEKWFETQREATLGITSYSSVYSFIYIEPAEIRHEILIPLATLQTILPLKHSDPAFVQVSEQDAARELIRGWLADVNPVTINGTAVPPEFTRIDFYGLDLKDFASQAEARSVSLANGRVGIILTYRTPDDSIREMTLTWDRFHSTIRRIQSVIFAYPDQMQRFEFSRFNKAEDNQLEWQCPIELLPVPAEAIDVHAPDQPQLTIPTATIVLVILSALMLWRPVLNFRLRTDRNGHLTGRIIAAAILLTAAFWMTDVMTVTTAHPWKPLPEVPESEAADVFRRLHQGTYRALDFGSEDRVYDVLAATADGSLLEDLYLQLRQSLEMREQGGAVARVRSVEYIEAEPVPRQQDQPEWPGFRLRAQWIVAGSVEHWGHVHERQNQFDGTFFVEPREGKWKITQMEIADQQQLSQKTSLRKF